MEIHFLGAARTVTGSKYLVDSGNRQILVDCGLFQGLKELRRRNWDPLPIEPRDLDAVILTHAHLDHCGYVPLLVRNGFKGPIYCTSATRDLCEIILTDSGHIQEEDARYAYRKGFSKHSPPLPLYTEADAENSLRYFKKLTYGREHRLGKGLSFRFERSGHILGSAFVILTCGKKKITFSGDLGRHEDLLMRRPVRIRETDYLVLESTYGDRLHEESDPQAELKEVINETAEKKGVLLIPAFAVGRSQSILYRIHLLKEGGEIPDLPVYLNSPMAVSATRIFNKHLGEHRLGPEECAAMNEMVHFVNTVDESKALNRKKGPMIIVSASGMATGGRVLHHIRNFAPHEENTILFAGFQARGTRGDSMVRGAEEIKLHGQNIPVRAKVKVLNSLSAHADYQEILQWLEGLWEAPQTTFITHGEKDAAKALADRIGDEKGWKTVIPQYQDVVEL